MSLIEENFNQVYSSLLRRLSREGTSSTTRKGVEIIELFDEKFTFMEPTKCLALCRDLSFTYLEREMDFYISGSNKLSDARACSSFWKTCSDDGETINSNYGKLLFHDKNEKGFTQFDHALNCLKNNPQSKKAVMTLYDKENAYISNDNPCTMFLRLRICENNRVHMTSYMRSSDVYYGLPYDVPFFVFVQYCVALELGLLLGSYTHIASSLHKYAYKEEALEKAKRTSFEQLNEDYPKERVQYVHSLFAKNYYNLKSKQKEDKTNLDHFFMGCAKTIALNAKCIKKKVGSVLVDKVTLNVISSGYGGAKETCSTCSREIETDVYYGDECPSIHSEMRSVAYALKKGIKDFSNTILYVTHGPCDACLKLCDFIGIKEIVYAKEYKTDYTHWPNINVSKIEPKKLPLRDA